MWSPSVSLSVWANSWLAGVAAPDDVLDALSAWTPRHSVTAYDSVAADRTGLPWPDLDDAGAVSLLQTMRTVARPAGPGPAITLALPIPGDVRGLPPGTQFGRDAIAAGEAIVVGPPDAAVGLVPDFEYPDSGEIADDYEFEPELCALSWTVYSLDTAPAPEHIDLGEAEYALRDAVRSAADALGTLRAGTSGSEVADPRRLVEQVLDSTRAHRIPDHAPSRAVRVLENAAHVDAIITVSSGLIPSGLQSSSEVQIASDALRPLTSVVRSARLAAVEAILHSAWRG
ncbi:hypothetical protein Mycch_2474 [Mycolicibacterium chubuense NBB4]|uniref:Uncharacterized protein n=1 Tax=Mycolicibacterium chubuense (strain NBB4) TaxID=710421 RepID=I4BIZ0_MYCCN|nr:hypothetical protein [Mycolicibacterium chubuense]AFM17247.1 hypothetical protein Mycch_2474 [Mycolicibacterium chubuense NBB4]